jgi:N-acetylmuramoyl-L-alanine amidase
MTACALMVLVIVSAGCTSEAATTTTVPTVAASTTTVPTVLASTTTVTTAVVIEDAPLLTSGAREQVEAGNRMQPVDLSAATQGHVTRGQLAMSLAALLGLEDSAESYFVDVGAQEQCFGAVGALQQAKLLTGVPTSQFLPDQLVSRDQALAWIADAVCYKLGRDENLGVPFRLPSSGSPEEWLGGFRDRGLIAKELLPGVANAYRLGLIDVPSDGCLYPALSLQQADMTAMLARASSATIDVRTSPPQSVPAEADYPSLEVGSTGPFVWYLEYRLATLKYRLGPVDGVFDIRTRDAVLAFQKVEWLERDGVIGDQLWEKLVIAQTPTPKASEPGTRVEVDLTRQVLFMVSEDKVTEIVHVSTGGVRSATLRGDFTIDQKRAGRVVGSYKIPMYYVSYFHMPTLLAIHGEARVPPWPESHGCVRVPIWIAKELYDQLPLGTHVYIYK